MSWLHRRAEQLRDQVARPDSPVDHFGCDHPHDVHGPEGCTIPFCPCDATCYEFDD